jgi:intraflagellar transport protein 172
MDIFAMPNTSSPNSYQLWADLRTMLFDLSDGFTQKPTNAAIMEIFEKMLLVSHYYALRCATKSNSTLEGIAARISVSLLRYSDLIPCDKAFFEAGTDCKSIGWDNMAFVFLNRYLDLSEGIEEQNLDDLDNTDFEGTDIPMEVNVPEQQFVSESKREEVKEWVLAVSMDQKVDQTLPLDERGMFEGSVMDSLPCVITGYPVLRNKVEFKKANKAANKDDWNKFAMATKVSHNSECQDVLRFLSLWCGASPNSFSFM